MNGDIDDGHALSLPATDAADEMVARCRSMFRRHLAAWASDCLILRRAGIDELRWLARDGAEQPLNLAA